MRAEQTEKHYQAVVKDGAWPECASRYQLAQTPIGGPPRNGFIQPEARMSQWPNPLEQNRHEKNKNHARLVEDIQRLIDPLADIRGTHAEIVACRLPAPWQLVIALGLAAWPPLLLYIGP